MPYKTEVKNSRVQFEIESDEHMDYNSNTLDSMVSMFLKLGRRPPGLESLEFDWLKVERHATDPVELEYTLRCRCGRQASFYVTYDQGQDNALIQTNMLAPGFRPQETALITSMLILTRKVFFTYGVSEFKIRNLT